MGELGEAQRESLREFCDDPIVGRTRASFLTSARAAKCHRSVGPVECDLPPEDDPEEDLAGGDTSAGESLPHLDWFDSVSYEALRDWVPTMGTVPKGAVHAVARLKGAVLQGLQG